MKKSWDFIARLKKMLEIDNLFLKMKLKEKKIIIATFPHTIFVAELLKRHFIEENFDVKILMSDGKLKRSSSILHIVICPQVFSSFPRYFIAFQLEQLAVSKWWTEEYQAILGRSLAIFDYSENNIDFLNKDENLRSKLHYLPLAPIENYTNADYDLMRDGVIFYGAIEGSSRRMEASEILTEKFDAKILTNSYQQNLQDELQKRKVVVNLHYYDGALLETPRICESLSLGNVVVSEKSHNMNEYPELMDHLIWFTEKKHDEMVEKIIEALSNYEIYRQNDEQVLFKQMRYRTRDAITKFLNIVSR